MEEKQALNFSGILKLSSSITVNFCASVECFWAVSQGKFDREILILTSQLALEKFFPWPLSYCMKDFCQYLFSIY